jgi:hypothetical protein
MARLQLIPPPDLAPPSVAGLSAALVTAAVAIRAARADELPGDTNTIESLTVEQAKKLVEEFPGVEVKFTSKDRSYNLEKCLPLNGIQKRALDVAQRPPDRDAGTGPRARRQPDRRLRDPRAVPEALAARPDAPRRRLSSDRPAFAAWASPTEI